MEKYYTPTIDEFHIGFEFEYVNDEQFKEVTNGRELYTILEMGDLNDFKVKYLDQKDIESLGWKNTGGKLLFTVDQLYEKGNYKMIYNFETKKIGIIVADLSKDDQYLKTFVDTQVRNLIIKNKSELKRLLKQLNIL